MQLSFSTRGWNDLTFDRFLDIAGEMDFSGIEVYRLIKDRELYVKGEAFDKYNRLEIYRHAFFTTAYIYNNIRAEGVRVGIGAFGVVVPTVNFNDFLFKLGPMHKGYNQKILQRTVIKGSSSFADNPELGL